MGLRVKHPLVQTPPVLTLKEQPCILQRFREPKALHFVLGLGTGARDVVDGAVAVRRARAVQDGRDHFPARCAPVGIARDAVHVEDGFERFGARYARLVEL
jgi:hypothetical protein